MFDALLDTVLITIGSIYVTWIFYLAVMNLMRARENGTITKPALIMGWPIAVVGIVLDFLLHVFLGTVMFLELPKEWLFTKRFSRLIREDMGWRGDLAAWWCVNLLDTFDPDGKHCAQRKK